MGQFRKKPVVIEAFQVTNDTLFEVAAWCDGTVVGAGTPRAGILINTLEGTMRADLGDWVIRGIKGEFYPCKPDIFEATYDPVEDTETLEAGVVVVPVEVAREYVESHRVPPTPNAAENQRRIERAIAATQRLDEHLAAALSRLQQNVGEGR